MSDLISREFLQTAIHNFFNGLNHTPTEEDIQRYIEVAPSVENKAEPTDEEVIEYCNKRGYVICTQAVIDDFKREQHRIQIEGYVGVDGLYKKGGEEV